MAWLTGWSYRKPITITGQAGATANYQIKLLLGESSGATGENFDVGSKSNAFPSDQNISGDIRFTDNDGETLLDFWVEDVSGDTPNRLATIWVEVKDAPSSDITIYCYYGGDDTNVSSGEDTFILFDDFERGDDGDAIGGIWTTTTGSSIDTAQAYSGTRSALLPRESANSYLYKTYNAASNAYAIRCRMMVQPISSSVINAQKYFINHGDGVTRTIPCVANSDEGINYFSGGWQDSGADLGANTWGLIEVNHIDFDTNKYDIWLNNVRIVNDISQQVAAWSTNSIEFSNQAGSGDVNFWIDDFIVRNWNTTEPSYGSSGSEEEPSMIGRPIGLLLSLTISSVSTDDDRDIGIGSSDNSQSDRSVSTYGVDTISSDISIELIGKSASLSDVNLVLSGSDTLSSDIDLSLHGKLISSSDANLELGSVASFTSDIDIILHGVDTSDSERAIEIGSWITESDDRAIQVYGVDSSDSDISLAMHGEQSVDSVINIISGGKDIKSAEISIVLYAEDSGSSDALVEINSKDTATSETDLVLHGKNSCSGTINLELSGISSYDDYRDIVIYSQDTSSSDRTLEILPEDVGSSEISLVVHGESTSLSYADIILHGKDVAVGYIDISLHGVDTGNSERDIVVYGEEIVYSDSNVTLHGKDTGIEERGITLDCRPVINPDDSERNITLYGSATESTDREISILSKDSFYGDVSIVLCGKIDVTEDRTILLHGENTDSSYRTINIYSEDTLTGARTLDLHGVDTSYDEIQTVLHGKSLLDGSIGLELYGVAKTLLDITVGISRIVPSSNIMSCKPESVDLTGVKPVSKSLTNSSLMHYNISSTHMPKENKPTAK